MAIKQFFQRIWAGKSASGAGGTPFGGMGPGPFGAVDLFRKQRPASAQELINENVNTAYACSLLNATGVAKTPLRLYVQTRRGESPSKISKRGDTVEVKSRNLARLKSSQNNLLARAKTVEEVVDHPLLDLLNNPNPTSEDGVGMNLYQLLEVNQLYQEVVGRSYWYIPLDGLGGRPSAIWILPSQHTSEILDPTGQNIIQRYTFGAGTKKSDYQPAEIVPFRHVDLNNPYIGGVSPARAVLEKTRVNRKFDAKTNALLSNGGLPSAMFVPSGSDGSGGVIDKSMKRRLQAQLQARLAMNQGGVMVAEHAGQVHTLEWPMRDIADADWMRMSKGDICNGYHVPVGLLDPQEQNLTAIQAAQEMHATQAIDPRLRRTEGALNRMLVSKYDDTDRLFVAFDSPHPDDGEQNRADSKVLLAGKALTRNELRQRHGLDPLEGDEGEEMVGGAVSPAGTEKTDIANGKKSLTLRRQLLAVGYTPAEVDAL